MNKEQLIADARTKYFDKFVGCYIAQDKACREKYQSDWLGFTPDEAMELADKIVDWLYSPHEQTEQD